MARTKRAKHAKVSKFHASKQAEFDANDYISQLPDELLTYIESFLTLKERARTNVLSRRWRDINKDDWTPSPRLIFDALEVPDNIFDKKKLLRKGSKTFAENLDKRLLKKARSTFAKWIDEVIKMNEAPVLEELTVSFYFGRSHKASIDNWLNFALARKVRKLELNFSDQCSQEFYNQFNENDYYAFPHKELEQDTSPSSWRIDPCNMKNFSYIQSLSLISVAVSRYALDYFLTSCPLLERLVLGNLKKLQCLKIVSPSISLKCLEIWHCYSLNLIEICDTSLKSFTYVGNTACLFNFKNLLWLVEVHFGGYITHTLHDLVSMLLRCIPHVETLTLSTYVMLGVPIPFKKFNNLKHLIWQVPRADVYIPRTDVHVLLTLTVLIKASPLLEKLVLKQSTGEYFSFSNGRMEDMEIPNLKEVELYGYTCGITGLEIIMYFMRNAAVLKKVVIDHSIPYTRHTSSFLEDVVRSHTKQQLEGRIPAGVEVIIL